MTNTDSLKYQIDLGIKIQDKIEAKTDKVAPVLADVLSVLNYYGISSSYSWHRWAEEVYLDLGFDYDEVEDVA